MKAKRTTKEERFNLIMECRNSGLSDFEWCEEHGINLGTFYNWITRFRKEGYPEFSEKNSCRVRKEAPEIVKIELAPEYPQINNEDKDIVCSSGNTYSNGNGVPSIEICTDKAAIRISNDVDPTLLKLVLSSMGGV